MTKRRLTDFIADLIEKPYLIILLVVITGVALWGHWPKSNRGQPTSDEAALDSSDGSSVSNRLGDSLLVIDIDELFSPDATAAIRDVVQQLEELPQIDSTFWLDDVPTVNLFGLEDPIIPPNNASIGRFNAAREKAINHPLAKGQLISSDGKTLLVAINYDWLNVETDEAVTTDLIDVANSTIENHPVEARFQITGRVPLYLAAKEAYDRNDVKFQIIGYTMALLLAIFIFRGMAAVFIVSVPPALAIFWSLAAVKIMGEDYNPLTSSVMPVLISMVGLTDGVHLMIHIRKARAGGANRIDAAKSAIRDVGLACLLTSVTTAIGFGSLMLAENDLVQGFGRACSVGVLLTFIAVITVIPLLSISPIGKNVHKGHEKDIIGRNIGFITPLIDWVMRDPRITSALGVTLTVVLGLVTLRLSPDDKRADSQPSGSRAYQALLHCDRAFGGIDSVGVKIRWPKSVPSDSTKILEAIEDVEEIINSEQLVQNPISIRNFVDSFGGEPDIESRMSYLALVPEQLKSSYFDEEYREAAINARVQDLGIAKYVPVFERMESKVIELSDKYEGFTFKMTGSAVNRGRTLYQMVVDLATSLGTATVIILIVMAITYRSLRIGLITLVPNLFPLVVTGTGLVLAGQTLDISGVCAFTICLGIAVDDTIHFLTRYQIELDEGNPPRQAIRNAFMGVGSALIMTTLILVACFSTVLTSELRGHRTFAAMACSTIGAALVGDLIFLPALLLVFAKPTDEKETPEPQAAASSV